MPKASFADALQKLGTVLDSAVAALEEAANRVRREAARLSSEGNVRRGVAAGGRLLGDEAARAIHAALEKAHGPLTSRELSRRTGVARTSIARHIRALSDAGVKISSAPRRGYELGGRGRLARAPRGGGNGARGRFAQKVILETLQKAKRPVLGDVLAKKADVSKMTITRMIVALRKEGHEIVGRRGVGYSIA